VKKSEEFISVAIREFRKLRKLSDDAVRQISKEQFFLNGNATDNSIAVIHKHVAGNLISRWTEFRTSDGEKPYRNSDAEYEINDTDSYDSLIRNWEKGWTVLFDSLEDLSPDDLARSVTIRGESLSALQAIASQLTHYAYHVGQVVYLAKRHAGAKWESLSIPLGKSTELNRTPINYIEKAYAASRGNGGSAL